MDMENNVGYSVVPPPDNTLAQNWPSFSGLPPSYSSLVLTDLPSRAIANLPALETPTLSSNSSLELTGLPALGTSTPPSYSSLDRTGLPPLETPTPPSYSSLDLTGLPPLETQKPPSYSSLDLTGLPPLETPKPPSYSSLDLTGLPAECNSAADLHRVLIQTTVPTQRTKVQLPSYMLWSIISTLLFCPLGFVALIFSLKVRIAAWNNDAGSAWKSHMIARRINILATAMGLVLVFYYMFLLPLMNSKS